VRQQPTYSLKREQAQFSTQKNQPCLLLFTTDLNGGFTRGWPQFVGHKASHSVCVIGHLQRAYVLSNMYDEGIDDAMAGQMCDALAAAEAVHESQKQQAVSAKAAQDATAAAAMAEVPSAGPLMLVRLCLLLQQQSMVHKWRALP
jgi:hypothetical protein